MHDSDPFEGDTLLPPELQDAARAYHAPPPIPREAMWRAIEAERQVPSRSVPFIRRHRAGWYVRWGAAAAALVAIGVGVGRFVSNRPGATPVAAAPAVAAPSGGGPAPARASEAYRIAAAEHLAQAEVFLTLFRVSAHEAGRDRLASATARQLLASNRLLLDSPAGANPRLKLLLQDLELVLVQIAQLSPARGREDLEFIRNGLERDGVLPRLRAAVPSGGPHSLRQGAL
jgi:hypothetical protein